VHENGALSKHVEPFFGERFRDACRGYLWTNFRGTNRPVWSYGNVLVVTVISKLRKKKQPTDLYVQTLAIADLGILTFTFSPGVSRKKRLSTGFLGSLLAVTYMLLLKCFTVHQCASERYSK